MMKTKSLKAALLLLLMLLMALTGTLGAGASETAAETLPTDTSEPATDAVMRDTPAETMTRQNAETGYRAILIDEDELLTDEECGDVMAHMLSLTKYGNVAFWTTRTYASDEIEQARLKRKELFNYDSAAIFVINMNIRKLTIQTYGFMEQYVNASKARSITDNVKHYASSQNYSQAAEEAFDQMLTVITGGIIPEPMKYAGYVILALMAGVIASLAAAFSTRSNPLIETVRQVEVPKQPVAVCQKATVQHMSTHREAGRVPKVLWGLTKIFGSIVLRGGGGGGGSSSGGGGCGSGCGSSGGGGGGCGSGGSSSF